jgi:hypothetical protein
VNPDAGNFTTMLEILTQQLAAASLDRGAHNERIPPRERMVAMKVERGVE